MAENGEVHHKPIVLSIDDKGITVLVDEVMVNGKRYVPECDGAVELRQAQETCAICGHLWRQHDPEDGMCDSHSKEGIGTCECGRDLAWMQRKIAALSHEELSQ